VAARKAGGGKSYLGCVWLILSCLKYKRSRWLMGRAVLKTLKQTTLLTFYDICRTWGLIINRDFKISQEAVIRWANGSEIYLKDLAFYPSDPEYDSLGSTEFTGAFIDEASQIKNKGKQIVTSRIRYKLDEFGVIPKTLIASNPTKNFLYKDFFRPWKEKKLEPYRSFIPSLVQDNPYISPHYIENLKKLDPISKQRLLYGNFDYDDDPARLMDYDDILDMFTNVPTKSKERYLTCDVARKGKDLTTIGYWEGLLLRGVWGYQYKTQKHLFSGVQTISGNPTKETVKLLEHLSAKFHVKRSNCAVDEDGVGGGVVDYFEGCRGFVNNSKPKMMMGKKTNYSNLKSQCFFTLADLVKLGTIGIRTSNEDFKEAIIQELEQIKQKDIGLDKKLSVVDKEYIKTQIDRSPDFADMIMMRMLFHLEPRRMGFLLDPENITGLF